MTTPTNNTTQRFRFILDTVPDWWKTLPNVRIDVGACIALIPNAEQALPGDWIIREPDGRIRTESYEQGRVEARQFLIDQRAQIKDDMKRERSNDH